MIRRPSQSFNGFDAPSTSSSSNGPSGSKTTAQKFLELPNQRVSTSDYYLWIIDSSLFLFFSLLLQLTIDSARYILLLGSLWAGLEQQDNRPPCSCTTARPVPLCTRLARNCWRGIRIGPSSTRKLTIWKRSIACFVMWVHSYSLFRLLIEQYRINQTLTHRIDRTWVMEIIVS